MKTKVYIQNLKCGGCAKRIETTLNSIEGITVISINTEQDYVEFSQDEENLQIMVLKKLNQIGYPPKNTDNSIGLKAKSMISCMRGRIEY